MDAIFNFNGIFFYREEDELVAHMAVVKKVGRNKSCLKPRDILNMRRLSRQSRRSKGTLEKWKRDFVATRPSNGRRKKKRIKTNESTSALFPEGYLRGHDA